MDDASFLLLYGKNTMEHAHTHTRGWNTPKKKHKDTEERKQKERERERGKEKCRKSSAVSRRSSEFFREKPNR